MSEYDYGATPGAGEERGTAVHMQDKAREVGSQVGEMTQDAREQARGRARDEVDRRSTQAGEQVSSTAEALRRTGSQLRDEGKDMPARVADQAAERAERLGGYLQEADADRILRDIEDFGRRRPWVLAAAGATLGFLASRFLKASSSRRYESVTPVSNQQIEPALDPASTTPRSHASRRITSRPCRRQTASMFAVLPPPTKIASCSSTNSRRSSGGVANSFRCDGRHLVAGNARWKRATR